MSGDPGDRFERWKVDLVGTFFGVLPEEENHAANDGTEVNTCEDMMALSDQDEDFDVDRPEDHVKSLSKEGCKIKVFDEGVREEYHSNELPAEEASPEPREDIDKGQVLKKDSDKHYREEEFKDINFSEGVLTNEFEDVGFPKLEDVVPDEETKDLTNGSREEEFKSNVFMEGREEGVHEIEYVKVLQEDIIADIMETEDVVKSSMLVEHNTEDLLDIKENGDKSEVEFNALLKIENVDEVTNSMVEDLDSVAVSDIIIEEMEMAEVSEAASPTLTDTEVTSPESEELKDMFLQAGQSMDKVDSFDNPQYEVEILVKGSEMPCLVGNDRGQVEEVRMKVVDCGEEEDQTEESQDDGLMTGSHDFKCLVEVIDIDSQSDDGCEEAQQVLPPKAEAKEVAQMVVDWLIGAVPYDYQDDEVVIESNILFNESATNAQDQEKAWYADTCRKADSASACNDDLKPNMVEEVTTMTSTEKDEPKPTLPSIAMNKAVETEKDTAASIDASKVVFACLDIRLKTGFPAKVEVKVKNCVSFILSGPENSLFMKKLGNLGSEAGQLKFFSQSRVMSNQVRKDLVFVHERDAAKFYKSAQANPSLKTFLLTESDLGYDSPPVLSEAEMMFIMSNNMADKNIMRMFDGKVELDCDGMIQFKFSSLASLNLFLHKTGGSDNTALGMLRMNMVNEKPMVLQPGFFHRKSGDGGFRLAVVHSADKSGCNWRSGWHWDFLKKTCNFNFQRRSIINSRKVLIFESKLSLFQFWAGITAKLFIEVKILNFKLEEYVCKMDQSKESASKQLSNVNASLSRNPSEIDVLINEDEVENEMELSEQVLHRKDRNSMTKHVKETNVKYKQEVKGNKESRCLEDKLNLEETTVDNKSDLKGEEKTNDIDAKLKIFKRESSKFKLIPDPGYRGNVESFQRNVREAFKKVLPDEMVESLSSEMCGICNHEFEELKWAHRHYTGFSHKGAIKSYIQGTFQVHPPYFKMVWEAILCMNPEGVSDEQIFEYVKQMFNVGKSVEKLKRRIQFGIERLLANNYISKGENIFKVIDPSRDLDIKAGVSLSKDLPLGVLKKKDNLTNDFIDVCIEDKYILIYKKEDEEKEKTDKFIQDEISWRKALEIEMKSLQIESDKLKGDLRRTSIRLEALQTEEKNKRQIIGALEERLVLERKAKYTVEVKLENQEMEQKMQDEIVSRRTLAKYDSRNEEYSNYKRNLMTRNLSGLNSFQVPRPVNTAPEISWSNVLSLTWRREDESGSNYVACLWNFLSGVAECLDSVIVVGEEIILKFQSSLKLTKALSRFATDDGRDYTRLNDLKVRARVMPDELHGDYCLTVYYNQENFHLQSKKQLFDKLKRAKGDIMAKEGKVLVRFSSLTDFVRAMTNPKLGQYHRVFMVRPQFELIGGNGEDNFYRGRVCLTESNLLSIHYKGEEEAGFAECFSNFLKDRRIMRVDMGRNLRLLVTFHSLKDLEECLKEYSKVNCNTLAKLINLPIRCKFVVKNSFYSLLCPSTAVKKDFLSYQDLCRLEAEPNRISSKSKLCMVQILRDQQQKYPEIHFTQDNFHWRIKRGQSMPSQKAAVHDHAQEDDGPGMCEITSDYEESAFS